MILIKAPTHLIAIYFVRYNSLVEQREDIKYRLLYASKVMKNIEISKALKEDLSKVREKINTIEKQLLIFSPTIESILKHCQQS